MWNFDRFSGNIALIEDTGASVTYDELARFGEELVRQVGGRCLVFSLCSNTLGSVIGYTAFLNHKIVPVLLNAHLEKELRDELIASYHPAFIWAPAGTEDLPGYEPGGYTLFDYALFSAKEERPIELYPELALLLTTSGSTGSPKFVRQSYENIRANTDSIVEYLKLTETERAITTLPMNYTYGLSIITTHLACGATLLLTDHTLIQKEFWKFFKEQGATSFGGVPYTFEMLDKLRFSRMELPSLRYMTQAGGKLTPELHKKFAEDAKEKGRQFIIMYGQCEATARMGYLPAEKAIEKYGSMGIAIPGGRFSLIDAEGNEITEAEVTGELVYYGPNVTLGYAEEPKDLMLGDERGGRLETGDMAKRDEDGFYYIVGRKKRFLKIYGNRVNLDELDRLIKTAFDNIDCACSGKDDHLVVFLTERERLADVRQFVIEKTGFNPVAIKSEWIEEIPKNDSGKVLHKILQKEAEERIG